MARPNFLRGVKPGTITKLTIIVKPGTIGTEETGAA
jgi:hypothetical protein